MVTTTSNNRQRIIDIMTTNYTNLLWIVNFSRAASCIMLVFDIPMVLRRYPEKNGIVLGNVEITKGLVWTIGL